MVEHRANEVCFQPLLTLTLLPVRVGPNDRNGAESVKGVSPATDRNRCEAVTKVAARAGDELLRNWEIQGARRGIEGSKPLTVPQ